MDQNLDLFDFLDFAGAIGNGFEADAQIPLFIEKVLEAGEINNTVEKVAKLDTLLPLTEDGNAHPLYYICLFWLERMGLIERETGDGGILDFQLLPAGFFILQSMRDARKGFQ